MWGTIKYHWKLIAEFNQSVGIEQGVIIEPVVWVVRSLRHLLRIRPRELYPTPCLIFSTYPDKAKELDQLVELCDPNNYFSHDEEENM